MSLFDAVQAQCGLPVVEETENDTRRACADVAAMRKELLRALGQVSLPIPSSLAPAANVWFPSPGVEYFAVE